MKHQLFAIVVVAAALLTIGTGSSRAEDWKTTDGKTYQDVQVVATRPDMVTITHQEGVSMVPMEKLTPDLQKRFNYDPAKAKAFGEERAKLAAAHEQNRREEKARTAQSSQADAGDSSTAADSTATSLAPEDTASSSSSGDHHSEDSIADSSKSLNPSSAGAGHSSIDSIAGSIKSLRHDLNDPSYHTTANMVYTIRQQGLGPDKSDPNHHSMSEITGSGL